ncbi:hypothetical protein K2173_010292 [Erythroxylum novogranatense]|uniref:Late embryogenesis abundant protein n=1 Tax=Erythroxylum novogranatense TaxID=1862640 RepID=A0AAV8TD87_9ROSI|nr:hypothetical protein K2173_010292 [Erythroxylum novogranatense]
MFPETRPTHQSASESEGVEWQKDIDREIKDMVNSITQHIDGINRPGDSGKSPHLHEMGEDENGVRILTLAGTNTGATMRTELDEKQSKRSGISLDDSEPDAMDTYVNSNFQSVNNSIMLQSTYKTNDPGVHMDIADTFEQRRGHKQVRKAKKKLDKDIFKSDQLSSDSD